MATLVFSAVGTAIGGPLGGALGALIGNQLDRAIVGSPKREGPRLKELAVTTSSYGAVIARHYGRMRAAGTVIWATDLKETKEKSGGAKGSPSITAYAYSMSFAVAVCSRPIRDIGRIWADGNLLRGAGGDLKVAGQLRIYNGHGDQLPDPLIASDRGAACPAFRNVAYCVFEDLQLGDFGNRLPSLTFEVIADDGALTLSQVVASSVADISTSMPLPGLAGYSDEGGPFGATLATLDQLYPMHCDGSDGTLMLAPSPQAQTPSSQLPEPTIDAEEDSFGRLSGKLSRRLNDERDVPAGLRYYDVDRDYQAGMQRAEGQGRPGRTQTMDFPGALSAGTARHLCNALVQRAAWSGDQLLWRIAEYDPALAPGQLVSAPGYGGTWRIDSWEWRTGGIELELRRVPPGPARVSPADPGTILPPKDAVATPTTLVAFELPWSGTGLSTQRQIHAAASSSSQGWRGAALYAVEGTTLTYLQPSGSRRSVVGSLTTPLTASSSVLFDRHARVQVQLASDTLVLESTTSQGLADGSNRALIGDEVMQFAGATLVAPGLWQLEGLLRGRGGTEPAAFQGHAVGAVFVLLNERPVLLDGSQAALAAAQEIAAIGLADDTPVISRVLNPDLSRKPLAPVHPRFDRQPEGSWRLTWTRRARGSWAWPDAGDVPLIEQEERYVVGVGNGDIPLTSWQSSEPSIVLQADAVAALQAAHSGQPIWVRQIGSFGTSDPLFLYRIE